MEAFFGGFHCFLDPLGGLGSAANRIDKSLKNCSVAVHWADAMISSVYIGILYPFKRDPGLPFNFPLLG